MLYQRVDIEVSGPKLIKGETVAGSNFDSGVIKDHAAFQSTECFCMLPKRAD
jgi:hypothetical protein